MKKLKVLDLFSGIGGFSYGLEKTGGFETVAFCEIDEHCHKVLNKHWPRNSIFTDVSKLKYELIDNRKVLIHESDYPVDGEPTYENFAFTDVDVICGGFPCQDISVAGKQKGLIDGQGNNTRSGLWFEYKRLIGEIKPSYVIIENVAALRGNGLVTVLQDLWTLGFDAEWHIISARAIGACHLRERIWVIAYPNRELLREQSGRRGGQNGESEIFLGSIGETREDKSPNTDNLRLWESATSEEVKQERWTEATASQRDWWEVESPICRVDDAISDGLYEGERYRKQRIKQLGNSIVPGIVEIIGTKILEFEDRKRAMESL